MKDIMMNTKKVHSQLIHCHIMNAKKVFSHSSRGFFEVWWKLCIRCVTCTRVATLCVGTAVCVVVQKKIT